MSFTCHFMLQPIIVKCEHEFYSPLYVTTHHCKVWTWVFLATLYDKLQFTKKIVLHLRYYSAFQQWHKVFFIEKNIFLGSNLSPISFITFIRSWESHRYPWVPHSFKTGGLVCVGPFTCPQTNTSLYNIDTHSIRYSIQPLICSWFIFHLRI